MGISPGEIASLKPTFPQKTVLIHIPKTTGLSTLHIVSDNCRTERQ